MDLEATAARIAPGLLRYCIGRTGDPSLAEEVAQEALTALVQRWRRHGPPESPEAFAFGIARRRAGRAVLRRRLFRSLESAPVREDHGGRPDDRIRSRGELAAVVAALARLSSRDRDALLLVAAGEVDTTSGAAALGISRSAFKMRVHRARARLASMLEVNHELRQGTATAAERS